MRTLSQWTKRAVPAVLAVVSAVPFAMAQKGAQNGEWHYYGGDQGNTRYAPYDQINARNFSKLDVAWRFKTDFLGPRREFQLEARR